MKPLICLVAWFFLLALPHLSGQAFQHPVVLNEANGLPSNSVNDIVQDREGFVWIATPRGLCRYDGGQVDVFDYVPDESSQLFTRNVGDIQVDEQTGEIWLATQLGLHVYNPLTNRFRSYLPDPDLPNSIPYPWIHRIHQDRQHNLWVCFAHHGMARYVRERDEFELFVPGRLFPNLSAAAIDQINSAVDLRQDVREDHIYWLATAAGLIRWDSRRQTARLFVNQHARTPTNKVISPTCLYQHANGKLVIGYWTVGFAVFDPATETFTQYPEASDATGTAWPLRSVFSVYPKTANEVWISSSQNLMVTFNLEQDTIQTLFRDHGRNPNQYYVSFKDQNQVIWGALTRGVFFYHPLAQHLRHHRLDLEREEDHHYNPSAALVDDDGSIWLNFYSAPGLYCLDPTTRHHRVLYRPAWASNMSTRSEWTGTGLLRTPEGRVLVSDQYNLYLVSRDKQRLEPFPVAPPWQEPSITDLLYDRHGNLWVATQSEGLFRFSAASHTWRHYRNEMIVPGAPLHYTWLWGLTEDEEGKIWMRAASGYSVYIPYRDSIANFPYQAGQRENFLNISDLAADDQGRIWIVGQQEGLAYLSARHPEWGVRRRFGAADGLKIKVVKKLRPDRKGNLWLLGEQQLARLSTKDLTFEHFEGFYGLPGYDAELNLSALDGAELEDLGNGRLALLYRRGFALFSPDSLKRARDLPRPYLRSFKVLDREYTLDSSLLFKREIQLRPSENFFSFEFSAIQFALSDKVSFKYQLEGVDDHWVDAGQRRYAAYTRLPGGRYTFRLQAANSEGDWNPEPLVLHINIAIPWWQTLWFKAAVALLLLGLVYGLYRYRIRQVRQQQQLRAEFEKKLAHMEMEALRAQMNPHFVFNSLNSIDSFIVTHETRKASEYLNNFARLIRLILQNSRSNMVPLEDEVEVLELYLQMEGLRFDGKFEYRIIIDDEVDLEEIQIPPMLIQPYVENAIWHGLMHKQAAEPGKVTVRIFQSQNNLHCIVEDNGIGREKAAEIKARKQTQHKRSYGMKITADRIQLINKLYQTNTSVNVTDLVTPDGQAAGTRVELVIPA